MKAGVVSRLGHALFGKWEQRARDRSTGTPRGMPPVLPREPAPSALMPDDHVLASLPCTRYWHHERRQEVMGKPPPGIPHWLRRFDWLVGWDHGWADASTFPRHVYCHPDATAGLLNFLRSAFSEHRSGAVLVVSGADRLLSAHDRETLDGLLRYFDKIFYESFDVEIDGIGLAPMALTEFYHRGFETELRRALEGDHVKSSLLVSAFGSFWPDLNQMIEDRRLAIEFSGSAGFATVGPFPQADYFDVLSRHSSMICPRGKGVQTPKWLEACLADCVPIFTDSVMTRAMVRKGAPILVVDRWSDIDETLLRRRLPEYAERVKAFSAMARDLDAWWDFSFGA